MLSILIPAYNFSVVSFVKQLFEQAVELGVPFEIRIYNDASDFDYVSDLGPILTHKEIVFRDLKENLGRARIRNLLASEARYEWLLFADADSRIPDSNYLSTYWEHRAPQAILLGGTAYQQEPPADRQFYFRWYYGRHREQQSAEQRNKMPFEGFSTHHFFCACSVFEKARFPEQVLGYGHEDTLFGLEIRRAGFQIRHLDNPLYHIGLEPTTLYLSKSKEALGNLLLLQRDFPHLQTRLSKMYKQVRKFGLAPLFRLGFGIAAPILERNFQSTNPSLLLFDLYRLGYFCQLHRQMER